MNKKKEIWGIWNRSAGKWVLDSGTDEYKTDRLENARAALEALNKMPVFEIREFPAERRDDQDVAAD